LIVLKISFLKNTALSIFPRTTLIVPEIENSVKLRNISLQKAPKIPIELVIMIMMSPTTLIIAKILVTDE